MLTAKIHKGEGRRGRDEGGRRQGEREIGKKWRGDGRLLMVQTCLY